MADRLLPSQLEQANHISDNTSLHPALHRSQGLNPHVARDGQQGDHGVPQPAGNVVMQREMSYPPYIEAPQANYGAAHYHPPPQPYMEAPYVYMHRDVGVVEPVPAQAHPFVPDVQDNHDGRHGYGAQFPAADLPEAFPGVWPHPAPPADIPPANDLRIIAGRFLNNPDTLVNILRIQPRPGGRFEVWLALELGELL